MKNIFKLGIVLLLTFLSGQEAYAQPDLPPEVPIDGGASLLAAAGVAYGAKKLFDYRKQKQNEETD